MHEVKFQTDTNTALLVTQETNWRGYIIFSLDRRYLTSHTLALHVKVYASYILSSGG